jgi:hypothetical protein
LFDFHIAYFEGEVANRQIHLSIGGFHLIQEYGLNTTIRVCLESRSIQRLIIIFPMIKHNIVTDTQFAPILEKKGLRTSGRVLTPRVRSAKISRS